MEGVKNCVYRFLNKDDEVIYIGKARNLKNRLYNHKHLPKECYAERTTIEYVEFETEDDMDFAERYYIPKYKPKYNYIYGSRDLNVVVHDFDKQEWKLYDSTDFVKKYNETIESLNEKIERLKIKLEILSEEEGWLLTNKKGKVDPSIYFKNSVKKELINQIRSRKEEVESELLVKKQQRFELITGKVKEDFIEYEYQSMIENETYSKEETFDLLYIKARSELYNEAVQTVLNDDGYSLTQLFVRASGFFTYNGLEETSHWLKWRDGEELTTNSVRSELAYQAIKEVEEQLEASFGSFTEVLRRVDKQEGQKIENELVIPTAEVFKVLSDK